MRASLSGRTRRQIRYPQVLRVLHHLPPPSAMSCINEIARQKMLRPARTTGSVKQHLNIRLLATGSKGLSALLEISKGQRVFCTAIRQHRGHQRHSGIPQRGETVCRRSSGPGPLPPFQLHFMTQRGFTESAVHGMRSMRRDLAHPSSGARQQISRAATGLTRTRRQVTQNVEPGHRALRIMAIDPPDDLADDVARASQAFRAVIFHEDDGMMIPCGVSNGASSRFRAATMSAWRSTAISPASR